MSPKRPLILLLAVLVLPSFAQQEPAEKSTSAARDFSKEAYTIERRLDRVTVENDGTNVRERTGEVKILSTAGVQALAVLKFAYTSANETVDIDYVRVRKPDGTIVKTPEYNIQDMPAEVSRTAPLYSDVHEKHVAVKGLGVGDTLEYLIRYQVTKPEVPGHFWAEYSFINNAVVRDEQLELNVPVDKYIKVVSPEFKPEIREEGGRRIYHWKHVNLSVPERNPDEIPRRISPNPDVQITTFASWADVGNWYRSLQKNPLQVTSAIQAKAAELTKGLSADDEKIRAIYKFVSLKYHYVGLDFGIGRYQPHAADDVLDNGYGDCKDKHTLLAALLKAAGIDAWPALIHATRKLDPDVPSPAQFNHVITVVPQGDKFVWLDTTPEVAPYGLILLTLRDKQALVIPTNQPPLLMTTPKDAPFQQEQEFSMAGKLSAEGTFTGHAEQSLRGDAEVVFRAVFRNVPESQWKDVMQRFSYSMNFGGDVSNVRVSPPDDIDQAFEISYDYVRKNYADWENDRQIVPPLPPMGVEVAKDAKNKKPQEPVLLGGFGSVIYRSRMELPKGYTANLPADCHLAEPFAEYSDQTRVEQGVMTTTRKLLIKKEQVDLSDWEKFRNFGRGVSDDEYSYIRLNRGGVTDDAIDIVRPDSSGASSDAPPESADDLFRQGTSAMQRRELTEAWGRFRGVLAKDPKYKGAHLNMGAILMAENKPGDALQEFQREQEISPNDVHAFRAAAFAANRAGDKDQAVVEARKAVKLEPGSVPDMTMLGGLLVQQKKYSDAVDVLESAVKAAPDNAAVQFQLGDAYLKNNQPEQGVTHMKAAVAQKDDDAMMLNNVAYTLAEANTSLDLAKQYGESSVDELDDQARQAESSEVEAMNVTYMYSLVWDTLGWVYFQQGDLKRAESWVRASWLLGEEAIVGGHLGQIYEKEGKKQQAAQMYEFALSVSSAPSFPPGRFQTPPSLQQFQPRVDRTVTDDITSRYEKLTGKKPNLFDIHRLPNGEWSRSPAEQLRRSRDVTVSNTDKISGVAIFTVVLKPGQVAVHYVSGDENLKTIENKLSAAHYPLELPTDSDAIVVVRITVGCHPGSPCVGTLVNPTAAPRIAPAG